MPEPGNPLNPDPDDVVPDLLDRLRSIVERARTAEWAGWSPEDTEAVQSALEGLAEFPDIVRKAIRSGFEIGREHGKREKLLAELEEEIAVETSKLAHQAWGRGR